MPGQSRRQAKYIPAEPVRTVDELRIRSWVAKRQGVIPRARPILETMRASGMYLSTQLLDLTLAEVGE